MKYKLSKYNLVYENKDYSLIRNPINGGMLRLSSSFSKKIIKDIDCDHLNLLKEYGIVVNSQKNEQLDFLSYSNKTRKYSDKLFLTIAPSLLCNFNCHYCFQNICKRSEANEQFIDDLVNFIKNIQTKYKSIDITWYGGEPLLVFDKIEKITLEIFKILGDKERLRASIITNGYYLDDNKIEKFSDLNINRIQVTLDGSRKKHDLIRYCSNSNSGSFDKILKNVSDASKLINIDLRVNINDYNLEDFKLLIDEIKEFNLSNRVNIYISRLDNINGTCNNFKIGNDYKTLYRRATEIIIENGFKSGYFPTSNPSICQAVCNHTIVISPDGKLYKCINDIGKSNMTVGDIYNGINDTSNLYKYLNYSIPDICIECKELPICVGGCPSKNLLAGIENFKCSEDRFTEQENFKIIIEKLIGDNKNGST